jgi:hypothetical protein
VDSGTPADWAAGASPGDPAALTFLTMTSRPRFRAEFKAGEAGTNFVCAPAAQLPSP